MYLHFALRRALYRHPFIARLYAESALRRWIRSLVFRFTDYVPIAYVELSSLCNAACIFCPYPVIAGSGKPLGPMAAATFDKILERLAAEQVRFVNLTPTTGELLTNRRWAQAVESIAALPSVRRVHFYTNAILLTDRNIEALMRMPKSFKLAINISTGGLDRKSYQELFGVDRFDRVRGNVNRLLAGLSARRAEIPTGIEVRLTQGQRHRTVADAARVYGTHIYRHAGINIRSVFDPIGGIISDRRLQLYTPADKSNRPCQLLGDTRFAADGSIWVCGCAVSEQPGHSGLRIGHHDDPAEVLDARRTALIEAWRERNAIPEVCKTCANYYLEFRGWPSGNRPMFARSEPDGARPAR